MALFGGPKVEVDPELAGAIVASTDHGRSASEKILAKNQEAIFATLGDDEIPMCITYFMDGMKDAVLVVTNRRTFSMRKEAIRQQLLHTDVAETKIGQMPNGEMLVTIESHESKLDFSPNDPARFGKIIQLQVATPRVAQSICAVIDSNLGG